MIKRFLIGFTALISIFLFTNKVSADQIDYTDKKLSYNTIRKLSYEYFGEALGEELTTSGDYSIYAFIYHDRYTDKTFINIDYYLGTNFLVSYDNEKTASNKTTIKGYSLNYNVTDETYDGFTELHTWEPYYISWFYNNEIFPISNTWFPSRTIYSSFVSDNFSFSNGTYNFLSFTDNDSFNSPIINPTNKTITIPIEHFYNEGKWENYYLYFSSPSLHNMNYKLTFEYINNSSDLPVLPVELILNDKVANVFEHMADIQNSKYTADNGFGGGFTVDAGHFGGGGGGGRFGDEEEITSCMATTPFTYNGSFANENIFGVVVLSLNSCSDLTGKTPDDFSTKSIKITYDAKIIDLSADPTGPSTDSVGDMLEDIRNEYELEQEEIKFEIFQPVIKLINDKLPIINQFTQILSQFKYDSEIDDPPVFKVNIPYFNLKNIEIFNFQFFDDYRDLVIDLQCFIMGIYTAFKSYKIVSGYFGGGNNE